MRLRRPLSTQRGSHTLLLEKGASRRSRPGSGSGSGAFWLHTVNKAAGILSLLAGFSHHTRREPRRARAGSLGSPTERRGPLYSDSGVRGTDQGRIRTVVRAPCLRQDAGWTTAQNPLPTGPFATLQWEPEPGGCCGSWQCANRPEAQRPGPGPGVGLQALHPHHLPHNGCPQAFTHITCYTMAVLRP